MNPVFLIILEDLDGTRALTICKSQKQLSRLMAHLDEEHRVVSIDCIGNFVEQYTDFCEKNTKLEFGDHGKN
jgi:adenosyl cobinamide kinase/adenosyl cobinamide phosphate guanylyltransferase